MIVMPLSLMTIPIVLVIWALDSLMFAAMLRVLFINAHHTHLKAASHAVAFTDALPKYVHVVMVTHFGKPVPTWAAWSIAMISMAVLRGLLIAVLTVVS